MNFSYFDYIESEENTFGAKECEWITFLGDRNNIILDNLMFKENNNYITINSSKVTNKTIDKYRKLIGFSSFSMINVFLGETVKDELAYGLESLATSKPEMIERIEGLGRKFKFIPLMEKSPKSLSASKKAKLSIARALITKPKILVLDNILSVLDPNDLELVVSSLKEFADNGGIILNFTNEIEETILGTKVIITDTDKIIISGTTLSVLNEEKIMKRLGYGLPFIVLLNKYLKDYNLVDFYTFPYTRLVGEIWK